MTGEFSTYECQEPMAGGKECQRLFGHKGEHQDAHRVDVGGDGPIGSREHEVTRARSPFWAWLLLIGLVSILLAMVGRFATAKPAPAPTPVESLIPALCIERDAKGTVTPCQP